MSRLLCAVLSGLIGLGLFSCSPESSKTEILWDVWGVPHIYASTDEQAFRAFGWAQMHNHGDLILKLYGESRARAAEYWGEEHADSDRWLLTLGGPRRARDWYERQTPQYRAKLDAFVEGLNDYARLHPDRIEDRYEKVLPVTGIDVLAHGLRLVHFSFVANPNALRNVQASRRGSNAWAIGPRRSASGNAMLLSNPHLPWSGAFLFFEAHVVTPEVNAYGVTTVGSPNLSMAFNDHLGWTHTVNDHDGQDYYELTLKDGGYLWDGEVREFNLREETLRILGPDGSMREEKWTVKESIHGPVVSESGGKAIALRVVGLDEPRMSEQWWRMAKASSLGEFEAALQMMQIPMFTVMYADREGHILHWFGGRTPVRPPGDWNWRGIVPGDGERTLWTTTHPYAELPRVLDPPSGWLQNANDPPWTTTFPPALDADDFPPYMSRRRMAFRPQRSARMLAEDSSITFDELIAYKHSTRLELADRIVDDLIAAAGDHGLGGPAARRAAEVLAGWDRSADAESRGAVLFAKFIEIAGKKFPGEKLFARAWSEDEPRATPSGLADPRGAARALAEAAAEVERLHGSLDVAWGEVHRLRADSIDLPGNGASGSLGAFRVIGYAPDGENRFKAVGGDSWVAAIEFAETVRAQAVLAYGNASQPGSPHRFDQLHLLSEKKLRPVWRSRGEVEAHLEFRESF